MAHVSPAEVVPVALGLRFVVRALLIPFAALAGYFVAWGLVFVMDAVVRAFFGTVSGAVGWLPYAGKVISSPVLAIEHKLTSFLGGLEQHFERQMAVRWHALASLVESLAADTKAAAIYDYHLAGRIATLWGNAATGGLMKEHAKPIKAAAASAAAAQRSAWIAQKAAAQAEAAAAGAIVVPHPGVAAPSRSYPVGRLGTRLAALAAALAGVIDITLPGLRARDRWLTDEIGRLWHRTRGERKTIGLGVFTALLITALGRLGLGRLHCLNRKNALKTLCGMNPNLLEALLADTALVLGTISIVDLAKSCQQITGACEDGLTFFVREVK